MTCPACGHANPEGARFCNSCGQALASAPAGPPVPAEAARERKHVTVLFADVQGSVGLAERVDSEVWRAMMEDLLVTVRRVVGRYEGTVSKFLGDGAMAIFGAPVAYEDHAPRACHAALDLLAAVDELSREARLAHGFDLSVRIGLNSGEVVTGAVGDDFGSEYTAIGSTVNLAARMEALAEPRRPYLTRSTAVLVEGLFELSDVGELKVKGVQAPVQAYALEGPGPARSRLDAAAVRGLSCFVGRGRELEALEAALERAASDGRVVGVMAEAGVGKSRLCREFADRCRERGMQVTVGTGVAHGRRIPLLPVIEMLRGYFGIEPDDDARVSRAKIAGRLLLMGESFRESLPLLFDFMSVPDPDLPPPQLPPEGREQALFTVMRRILRERTDDLPGLILIEDLHWLDPGSEVFLRNLVQSVPGSRTLLVANFRPEYTADWAQGPHYEQLELLPFDRAGVARMVAALVGHDPSLDGVADLVAERTGGNPFFVEELVRSLVEAGTLAGPRGAQRLVRPISDVEIPATVQALLAARIDRLPEREKAVLQGAAVIGREFHEPVLAAVLDLPRPQMEETLRRLCRAELLERRAARPEVQWAFKHPLTQEVAYGTQLVEERRRAHGAVAAALERLQPDRLEELAAVISSHYERAGDRAAAALWGARAAVWAGQSHPADALRHWRRVRTLVRDAPESPEGTDLELTACLWTLQFGWRLGIDDEEVQSTYKRALALAVATQNYWALGAAEGGRALADGMTGNLDEALRHGMEAKRLAELTGDLELYASVGPAYWLALKGRTRESLSELEEALERLDGDWSVGRRTLGFSAGIFATFFSGMLMLELGRLEQGRAAFDRGLRLAAEHDDVESLGWAHSNRALIDLTTGEEHDGLTHARRGVAIADRLGSSFSNGAALYGLALAHLAREEWEDAFGAAGRARGLMQETRTSQQYEPWVLWMMARSQRMLGDQSAARELAEEGLALAERQGAPLAEGRLRTELGLLLAAESPTAARAELEHALELCEEESPVWVPHVRESLAELAALHDREDARERQLELALAGFREQGASGHARRVAESLAAPAAQRS